MLARTEGTIARETGDVAVYFGDKDGKTFIGLVLIPLLHHLQGERVISIDRGRVEDSVVVNGEDAGDVGGTGGANQAVRHAVNIYVVDYVNVKIMFHPPK